MIGVDNGDSLARAVPLHGTERHLIQPVGMADLSGRKPLTQGRGAGVRRKLDIGWMKLDGAPRGERGGRKHGARLEQFELKGTRRAKASMLSTPLAQEL